MLDTPIAERYGAETVELTLIRPGQGGAAVYAAVVDGVKRALRISGPYLSARPDWIEFEGQLLAKAGSGVAAAIAGTDGRYGQPVEGGIAFLTEWADGDAEWPTPPAKARALGRGIAKLHLATQGLEVPFAVRPFDTAGLIDRPLSLLSEVADASSLTMFAEEMRARMDAVTLDQTTLGPIHGDVHQGNAHFVGDSATLFDFAQCGIGWRAFDLAGFLWPWRDNTIEQPEMRAACDAYIEGYQSVRQFTDAELKALPAFVRVRDLWEAGEWIATGDGRDKPGDVQNSIKYMADLWSANKLPLELG